MCFRNTLRGKKQQRKKLTKEMPQLDELLLPKILILFSQANSDYETQKTANPLI